MVALLKALWNGIKAIPGLVIPFLAKASNVRGWPRWLRWAVPALVVVAVLVGLGFLNYYFDLAKVLEAPWPPLRWVWLPLLFLLLYVLIWLGWWLWRLLGLREEVGLFPDIDAAWDEARAALDQAGIEITDVPLFLVLGSDPATEAALFEASRLVFPVRGMPRRAEAPLHVYANREGLYVSCAGASLLSRQAALLAEAEAEPPAEPPAEAASRGSAPPPPSAGNPAPEASPGQEATGQALDWRAIPLSAPEPVATLPEPAAEPAWKWAPQPARRHRLLRDTEEMERLTARLSYLWQLIARDRRPYCPLNGVLLLVPWAALESEAVAHPVGHVCHRELTTVREGLRVDCPLFVLVQDLDGIRGFRELVSGVPEGWRGRRVGVAFPLAPDLEPAAVPGMIGQGVDWLGDTLFPTLVYRLFRLAAPGAWDRTDALHRNQGLYSLLVAVHGRQKPLAGLLARALGSERRAPLLGGCYLAGIGRDPARDAAFVAGVFPLLVENQNYVSWTAEALAEHASYRRWTVAGYIGLTVLAAALVALIYEFWPRR
jgi:hypothetical protein